MQRSPTRRAAAGVPLRAAQQEAGHAPRIPRRHNNPETIRRYWRQPDRNIGIATGAVSGVWVLDIDGDDGAANLRALEARHGALPETWESTTGNGRHRWFKYTGPIPSSAGRIAPGLDVRGDGAYVIAPPSIHPSGRAYAWISPAGWRAGEAPEWLVTLARKRPEPPISERALANIRRQNGGPGGYGTAALDREIAALAALAPGGRNAALNRASFRLHQLVPAANLITATWSSG